MFTRVVGWFGKSRVYRGTKRRDAVRYKGRTLKGYVRVVRQNGIEHVHTCFYHCKTRTLQAVSGYQPYWLARKNNIILKTRG